MKLDRSLIKSQAKELIKGNVFKLFVIVFVVMLLAEGGTVFSYSVNLSDFYPSNFFSSLYDDNNYYDYDFDFDYDDYDAFNGFGSDVGLDDIIGGASRRTALGVLSAFGALGSLWSLVGLFLAPLAITLMGVFYQLIKGNNMSYSDEFSFVFGKTFDKNYWNKFLLNLLKNTFMVLLCLLFIIPGIIFYYKYYFTSFIMAEKPELSWKEAMQISKKMTNGHKGELFVLSLSFLGWFILMECTFGLVGIYAVPYIYTTHALYYENFKLRAYQNGEMSPQDFMTENERAAMFYQNGIPQPQANTYYQPQQNNVYQQPQENTYQQPPQQEDTAYEPWKKEYEPAFGSDYQQASEGSIEAAEVEAEAPAEISVDEDKTE